MSVGFIHNMLGVALVKKGAAGSRAHGVEVHEQIRWRCGIDYRTGFSELDDFFEVMGYLRCVHLVGAIDGDGAGRVDGECRLKSIEVIADEGFAN